MNSDYFKDFLQKVVLIFTQRQHRMAFKYFKHGEIDFELWDKCVENSANGIIYCLSWYLDIVCEKWDALIKEKHGEYIAIFPLLKFQKFGLQYLAEPHFANQLGLISREGVFNEDLDEVLLMLKEKFNYIIKYPLNISNSVFEESRFKNYSILRHTTYKISIDSQYLSIFHSFNRDRKNNIQRSKNSNLQIKQSDDVEALIGLFAENTANKIYGGVKEHQYQLLRRLFQQTSMNGMSKIFEVRDDSGELLSSCMLFFFKASVIKFFNGSTPGGRKKNADTFLTNELIKTYAGKYRYLDLERSSSSGVNRYKESWGANRFYYYAISLDNLPPLVKLVKKIRYKILTLNN